MISKKQLQARVDELEERLDNQDEINQQFGQAIQKLKKTKENNFDRRKTADTRKRSKSRRLAAKRGWATRRRNQERF